MASAVESGRKATRRRRMPRADRELQMLEVAEKVFAERGYQDASMEEIARRVGVTKPMLYAYFGSKEGLLLATIVKIRTDMTAHVMNAVVGAGSPREMLWRGIHAYHFFVAEHQQGWAVVRELGNRSANEGVEAVRRNLSLLIADLVAAHVPHVPELEREALGELIVGACERIELWRQTRPEVSPHDAAELVLAALWPGLQQRAADYGVDLEASLAELTA
ncbi:MAG: TetR/AcrR family transcriptional regulator [Dehalococcoidia bacterium]